MRPDSILLPPGGKTGTDIWSTPQSLFDRLSAEFGGFDLDPCTDGSNSKCPSFYGGDRGCGLEADWGRAKVFMNPPYSDCFSWMRKAFDAAKAGALVVCLVPARTDTAWWHEYAMRGEVRLLRGRLKFGAAKANAPFPSAVVIFYPELREPPDCYGWNAS